MQYEIIYSKRKTVTISVKRDLSVTVRAPIGYPKMKIEELVTARRDWIEKHIMRFRSEAEAFCELTEEKIKALRALAREVLLKKTAHFASIMGLKYGRITISGAKTRYGSCSSKGNISYSYLLMQKDERAIDYVVVHELAHLVYMNHSKEFYSYIERFMPDYKERKRLLKE